MHLYLLYPFLATPFLFQWSRAVAWNGIHVWFFMRLDNAPRCTRGEERRWRSGISNDIVSFFARSWLLFGNVSMSDFMSLSISPRSCSACLLACLLTCLLA